MVESLIEEGKTATRTRDLLALKEQELESSRTSTRTRDRLFELEAALKKKEASQTSTWTRCSTNSNNGHSIEDLNNDLSKSTF